MNDLVWSPQSLQDLESIRSYIAADSVLYADLMVRRIVAVVERLRIFPESGRMVPSDNPRNCGKSSSATIESSTAAKRIRLRS